jgi:putative tryptophan/tyrosine transport system substrate-binding protein
LRHDRGDDGNGGIIRSPQRAIVLPDSQWFSVFVQRLRELGWIEGRTVAIEVRWAEGRSERYAEIVGEFVRLKVDLIFTSSTPPTIVAKQATEVIPIVFAIMGDPVGTGLVASLARPGGNVTGLSNQVTDLAGKRLALLRKVVRRASSIGPPRCHYARYPAQRP